MQPYLATPEDLLARMFGSRGLLTSFDTETGDPPSPPYRLNHALNTRNQAANGAYDVSKEQLAQEVAKALSDDVLGQIDADTSGKGAGARSENHQTSFTDFGADDSAAADPQAAAQTAKAAYVTVLIYTSWIMSFGPLA